MAKEIHVHVHTTRDGDSENQLMAVIKSLDQARSSCSGVPGSQQLRNRIDSASTEAESLITNVRLSKRIS